MAMKHVAGDFEFPAEFGFTGSTKRRDDARSHVMDPAAEEKQDPYPESYISRQQVARGGRIHKAGGGDIQRETLSAPNSSFGSAFAAARKLALNGGPKTFEWNGKHYNTNLAPSAPAKSSRAAPSQVATPDYKEPYSGQAASDDTQMPTPPVPPDYRIPGPSSLDFSSWSARAANKDQNAQLDRLRAAQNETSDNGLRRGGRVKKAMGGGMPPVVPGRMPQQGMPQGGAPTAPGPAAMSGGGDPMSNATISMPVHDAKRMAAGLMTAGHNMGANQTVAALANAARARLAGARPPVNQVPGAAPPAAMARGGHLNAAARNALPKGDFALPAARAYPIPDANHARNALARVSGNGSPSEKATVRSAVHRKFPGIGTK